ncbi:MAG: radical SAM family heme chaperone HemW [Flavobacteriaceae bacterium]
MAGIYIHIPFCRKACHYCDFHFSTQLGLQDKMVSAMERELDLRKDYLKGQGISTLYFGGGTPSVLTKEELGRLISRVKSNFELSTELEICLEVNPDDIDAERLEAWKSLGVNRLSIGIQSFRQEDLTFFNRSHTAEQALEGLKLARKYFDNITADLIYGVQDMSLKTWEQNVQTLIDLDIPHISAYALTVEEKTALDHFIKSGKAAPLDEQLAKTHFEHLIALLKKRGFEHYEISNFAKPGFRSRHNSAYWQGAHYLGIGPGAHSFNGKTRSWNVSSNPKYIKSIDQGILPLETEVLALKDRFNEYVMTGLRTDFGIDKSYVLKELGEEVLGYLELNIEKYLAQNLISIQKGRYILNEKARFRADGIASDLFWV